MSNIVFCYEFVTREVFFKNIRCQTGQLNSMAVFFYFFDRETQRFFHLRMILILRQETLTDISHSPTVII